jgi:hypothetical protein
MNSTHPSPEVSAGPRRKAVLPFGVFRFSAIELLVALGLLFVTSPFIEDMPQGDLIEAVLLTLVMVFGVLAVGGRRRTLIIALVLLTPALGGKWINHVRPDLLPPPVFLVSTVALFGFVVGHLLRKTK